MNIYSKPAFFTSPPRKPRLPFPLCWRRWRFGAIPALGKSGCGVMKNGLKFAGQGDGHCGWSSVSSRRRRELVGFIENKGPGAHTIEGTMRFFSEETREKLLRQLDEAFGVLAESGARVRINVETGILPVVNDERVTEWVRAAVVDLVGEDDVLPIQPMTLAEDFSFLAHEAPGTFYWVGAALPKPRMHHEADFDIDESALPLGAATLAAGAIRLLEEMR